VDHYEKRGRENWIIPLVYAELGFSPKEPLKDVRFDKGEPFLLELHPLLILVPGGEELFVVRMAVKLNDHHPATNHPKFDLTPD